MGTTLRHIVIPVKNLEELRKAENFFINVLGLKLQKEGKGKIPEPKMGEEEANRRLPDYYCHIIDDAGLKIDLVAYDDGIVSYGKGVAIGFNVDNIKATWDAALKDYPVRPIFDPISYQESLLPILGHKEAYFAFLGLKMGRISNDGEEQIMEIIESKPLEIVKKAKVEAQNLKETLKGRTTLRLVIIPVKNLEELRKAKNFFINVLGLKLQKEGKGKIPEPKMGEEEANRRLPDHYCHIIDEAGLKIDLVAYDDGIVSYGKGVAIGFNVDNIKATWDAALKDYPVRPIFKPLSYPKWLLPNLGFKEGSTAFLGLRMGRLSNDGEDQILMMVEHRDI